MEVLVPHRAAGTGGKRRRAARGRADAGVRHARANGRDADAAGAGANDDHGDANTDGGATDGGRGVAVSVWGVLLAPPTPSEAAV